MKRKGGMIVKKICMIFLTMICFMLNANSIIYAQNKPLTFSFPINIKWGHSGLDREQIYELELKGLQKDTPMPTGSVKNIYTKTILYPTKTNSKILPDIQYQKQGNYEYKLTLRRGNNKTIKSYYLHIQVLNQKNGEKYLVASIRKGQQTGSKVTSIQFVDPGADEPYHDKDYKKKDHESSSEKTSKEVNEQNEKNKKNQKNRKGRITGSTKTGDERHIELYLGLCVISLGVILIMGSKKISRRK